MKNRLKNNTKIKIISLLSALVLWMYVMAIVDPEDTILFENVPVTVTNMDELAENDLVIYPKSDLVADINVRGKLSDIQRLTEDDIHIYGSINNPMEGNNKLSLKVNINKQVSYEFKSDFIVVRLEKLIYEEKEIKAEVLGKSKDDVDKITLSQNKITVSGPRVLTDKVSYIKAPVVVDNNEKTQYNQRVKLIPVDKFEKEVKGITLDVKNINADIRLLEEKEVPINIQVNGREGDISNYEINPSLVAIKGKKDILDSISYINTEKIDLESITSSKQIALEIPEGIILKEKTVLINPKIDDSGFKRVIYDSKELELKGNYEEIDLETLNIPDNINVELEFNNTNQEFDKSDIVLYIDLSQGYEAGKKYKIEYKTELDIKSITIIPSEVG